MPWTTNFETYDSCFLGKEKEGANAGRCVYMNYMEISCRIGFFINLARRGDAFQVVRYLARYLTHGIISDIRAPKMLEPALICSNLGDDPSYRIPFFFTFLSRR